jgi:hypothetical protein
MYILIYLFVYMSMQYKQLQRLYRHSRFYHPYLSTLHKTVVKAYAVSVSCIHNHNEKYGNRKQQQQQCSFYHHHHQRKNISHSLVTDVIKKAKANGNPLFYRPSLTDNQCCLLHSSSNDNSNNNGKEEEQTIEKTQSIGGSVYNVDGYNEVNTNLRSVLMHRIGPPLMAYLNFINDYENDEEKQKQLFYNIAGTFLPKFDPDDVLNDAPLRGEYNNVLEKAIKKWKEIEKRNERNLTKAIFDLLVPIITKNETENESAETTSDRLVPTIPKKDDQTVLLVENEKYVKNPSTELNGKADIFFSGEGGSVAAIYEFGLKNEIWWSKLYQTILYACACFSETNEYKFDKPILLVTITIAESKDGEVDAKFGVFLCTRRKQEGDDDAEKYRMALLWRTKTDTIHDASIALGKILYATYLCAKWGSQCERNSNDVSSTYGYLGPNCVRLGNKVRMYQLIIYVLLLHKTNLYYCHRYHHELSDNQLSIFACVCMCKL